MNAEREQIIFGPFRFDPVINQLWRRDRKIALQPKPLAVLLYLAQRPGQIVTKQELLKAVWAGTVVTKAVVKECIWAIRDALGEPGTAPQYLETIGREGYRWIAETRDQRLEASSFSPTKSHASIFVGREAELAQLHKLLDKALRGEPQLVFVTGEPGIGKTEVVDVFRAQLQATDTISLGYGQCVEHYGPGEPYLPVLEAMGRLGREAGGQQVMTLLRRHAPTWIAQLPGMIEESELETLRLQVQGATQQRMLREIAEAIEIGTVRRPLVLIFEDLHWSDSATIAFLAYLAKRRQPMRLLVVATYRPVDVVTEAHPLKAVKQELQAHGLCEEVRLELLKKKEIEAYVAGRFPDSEIVSVLAQEVYRRTDGNPLFMVNVVEHFLSQGLIVQENGRWALSGEVEGLLMPESLRQLIAQQVERLSETQRHVLEVASVVGAEFTVAAVAAALKQDIDEVETICEEVAWQGHFLEERGIAEWPDGTISGRYGFRHALYQNVLYERIAEARRIRLHRLIGERGESAYGERAGEIAAELAVHFERGHDYRRAVQYYEQAGKNAIRRSANVEAISLLSKGLALLKTLPDTPERTQQELMLQVALGAPLLATKGYAAPEVGNTYTRARELCQQMGETPQLFPVLMGLRFFYTVKGELQTARELGEQLLRLAQSEQSPPLLLESHYALAVPLMLLGEVVTARMHFEQSLACYDPQQHRSRAFLYGQDPAVGCLSIGAWTLWFLGYPEQALKKSNEAITLAQELSHAASLAFALGFAGWLHYLRRDRQATQARAERLIALSREQGLSFWLAQGTLQRSWALVEQGYGEEVTQMRQSLAAWQATGAEAYGTQFFAMLGEAYGHVGQAEEGLKMFAEALTVVSRTGEHHYEAELYRLKGELVLQSGVRGPESQKEKQKAKGKERKKSAVVSSQWSVPNTQHLTPSTQVEVQQEAKGYFLKAIDIARKQQAKSWELRATTSLARLWQQQNKQQQAHQMLVEVYGWFTEGFDTKDLQEAKALLEELR